MARAAPSPVCVFRPDRSQATRGSGGCQPRSDPGRPMSAASGYNAEATVPASTASLSLRQARAIALRAQGFGDRSLRRPVDVLDRLGAIQLDSVNVLARSQDIVPFSRIGPHPVAQMYQAIYAQRRGFEYWGHEASWLPIDLYRHFQFRRECFRVHHGWRGSFRPTFQPLYDHIRERIRVEGPLGSVAFEDDRPGRGSWWDWKPA